MVALLVPGSAAEALLLSLSCYFLAFAEMGATSTTSGRPEVNLFISGSEVERAVLVKNVFNRLL
jgi:hypothetical protein